MSIRRKILISNIIIVCVPIVLAFLLWFGYTRIFDVTYAAPLNRGYEYNGSLFQTQETLYRYEAELAKVDWDNIAISQQTDPDIVLKSDEMIFGELLDAGYHLMVETDGVILFSSMTKEDTVLLAEYSGSTPQMSGSLIHLGQKTILRDVFMGKGNSYQITAVYDESVADGGTIRSMMPVYMVSPAAVLALVLIVLAATAFTGLLLSRWLSSSILKPLAGIRNGAKQITGGNLNFPMPASSVNEFDEVCGEFEIMRRKLKEAEKERSDQEAKRRDFLTGVSHDLRSPLTSMKGYAMGLKDGIADTEEKRMRYYDAILTRANDMERLTASLSELIRLENSESYFHKEEHSLNEFIRTWLKEQDIFLRENHIDVLYEDASEDIKMDIDAGEMHRVFTNLFENTAKYRTEFPSLVRISVKLREKGNGAEVCFADDGPGVKPYELPCLFDSFYRTDESRTKPESGSGLGLAIVKRIVEGHGGSVSAYLDGGLGIRMFFPIERKRDEVGGEDFDC